jgi:hypothetical protein
MKLAIALISGLAAPVVFAGEKVSVYVEYHHGHVHINYPVPCTYAATCSLTSPHDADLPWKIEITPARTQNNIVSVKTVIAENYAVVSRSEILTKLGDESKIVSSDPDGLKTTLTVRPF